MDWKNKARIGAGIGAGILVEIGFIGAFFSAGFFPIAGQMGLKIFLIVVSVLESILIGGMAGGITYDILKERERSEQITREREMRERDILPSYEDIENDILLENRDIEPPGYEERENDRLVGHEDMNIEENPPSYENATNVNDIENNRKKIDMTDVENGAEKEINGEEREINE
ncbi:MAG: hypothetical protein J6Y29_01010 [Clostridiales bacterium]|nr:hypothetical protein [Clostridiales bacterium]